MFSGKKMVFAGIALLLVGALLVGGCSWFGGDSDKKKTRGAAGEGNPDALFLEQALQMSMTEVKLSEVAVDKTLDQNVKTYAQQMLNEHEQLNTMIKDLAKRSNIEISDKLEDPNKRAVSDIKSDTDANFDRDYITRMLADHTRLVTLFEERSRNATDPQIRLFAQQQLPGMQAHLEQSRRLAQEIGVQPGASGRGLDRRY